MKLFFATCLLAVSLNVHAASPSPIDLLPRPVRTELTGGQLTISNSYRLVYPKGCEALADYTSALIEERTGLKRNGRKPKTAITLLLDPSITQAGAYRLTVTKEGVEIRAAGEEGLRYGIQTLRQMLPVEKKNTAVLPCADIYDYPRFGWRGLHLDVSRHFFTAREVKRFLDIMAMYKFNRFHWHLTDDQGWRLQIKSHPELTDIGAWRKSVGFVDNQKNGLDVDNGKPYGGFYTQDEVRDVVAHAAKLGITVIPEIDLPGHSQAAITACPQIYCFPNEKLEVRTEGGVSKGVMCAGREETFKLLGDVLDEVIALFPAPYIHLGGDETPKDGWRRCPKCQERIKTEHLADEHELQSYFMKRLERYINAKGRKMIGWDEIMEGGVSPTATVMSWRSMQPGKEAAMGGNDVIMTPGTFVYLNQLQSVNPVTKATGDVLTLKRVYDFNPMPEGLTPEQQSRILGVEACQWSEHTPNERVLYYKEYPRAIALAEVAWTPQSGRQWSDFYARLQNHLAQLTHYGIGYGQPCYDVTINTSENAAGQPIVTFSTEVPSKIYYTLDGTNPTHSSAVYSAPLPITQNTTVKACMFRTDGTQGRVASQDITFHRALGKKVIYNLPYSDNHDGGGDLAMTNGMLGRWQGFEKQDADFVVDLGRPQTVDSILTHWKYDIRDWVLRPTSVSYEVSADGKNYTGVYRQTFTNPAGDFGVGILKADCGKHLTNVRYIRVKATNEKINPQWHTSAGAACWIFVDEVVVK